MVDTIYIFKRRKHILLAKRGYFITQKQVRVKESTILPGLDYDFILYLLHIESRTETAKAGHVTCSKT